MLEDSLRLLFKFYSFISNSMPRLAHFTQSIRGSHSIDIGDQNSEITNIFFVN